MTQRLVQDSLLASASAVPDKIAIADEYQRRTYAELSDDALRFARVLQDAGLERGDRVGLYLDNTVECAAAIFGVLIAGGAFTFINPQTKAGKLAFILNDSEARFLVTEAHSAGIAAAAVAEAPSVEQTFTTHREGSPEHFRDLREAIGGVAPEPADAGTDPSDLAALVYTSGTTGEPKGVMHSHAGLVFSVESIRDYLNLQADDRILSVLPIAFTYGLSQLLLSVRVGATLLLERSFTFPAKTLARLREEEATVFPAVPTVFATILAMSEDTTYPVRALPDERGRRAAPGPARGARARLPERVALPHVRPDGVHPRLLPGARADRRQADLDRQGHPRDGGLRARRRRPSGRARARRACCTCAARTS